jgi:hypothetical protein
LHVLGTPPAFVLSQDQTLREIYQKRSLFKNALPTGLMQALSSISKMSFRALVRTLLLSTVQFSKTSTTTVVILAWLMEECQGSFLDQPIFLQAPKSFGVF